MAAVSKQPPTGLGREAKALWAEVVDEYELRPDERRILIAACQEWDLIEAMQKQVKGGSLEARGSQGQPVAAPLVTEIRQHRATFQRLMQSLNLGAGEVSAESRSAAGRALVATRWNRSVA